MGSAASVLCDKTQTLLRTKKRVVGSSHDRRQQVDDPSKPSPGVSPGVETLLLPAVLHSEKIPDGHEARFEVGLESTPRNAAEAPFDKFCPICMKYYRGIFATACCGHYCCSSCAVEFVCRFEAAHHDRKDDDTLRCPFCNVEHLELDPVADGEKPRSYDDDNGVVRPAPPKSPVRIGDSDANLRRKLLLFSAVAAVVRDDDDDHVVANNPVVTVPLPLKEEKSPNTVICPSFGGVVHNDCPNDDCDCSSDDCLASSDDCLASSDDSESPPAVAAPLVGGAQA